MGWIKTLGYWVTMIFSPSVGRKIIAGIMATEKYLPTIYEWVKTAAEIAPQRTKDQLTKLADAFGVPELIEEYKSGDYGKLIAEILFRAAKAQWPAVPDRVIRRAIELAYGAIRP